MKKLGWFLLFLLPLFSNCSSSREEVLYLFCWSQFFDPSLIAKFEKDHHCRVVLDTYDSNESMYAKLKLGTSGYDIIFPSGYYLEILNKQGLIQNLDPTRIPNLKNLDPKYFAAQKPLLGVPFLVSFTGIAYRKDRLASINPTWGIFGQSSLKGRMTMLNDLREAIGAALKYLGYSINSIEPAEIAKAGDVLIQWKKNLAKFESEQYKSGIATAEFLVVQAYSIDVMQVRQEDPNVMFVFPEEGAIMGIDYMAISKDAKNQELAYAFINFFLEPEHAAQNVNFTKSLIPIASAYNLIEPELQKSPILFPPQEALKKMEEVKDLGDNIFYYFQTWEKVKGA